MDKSQSHTAERERVIEMIRTARREVNATFWMAVDELAGRRNISDVYECTGELTALCRIDNHLAEAARQLGTAQLDAAISSCRQAHSYTRPSDLYYTLNDLVSHIQQLPPHPHTQQRGDPT